MSPDTATVIDLRTAAATDRAARRELAELRAGLAYPAGLSPPPLPGPRLDPAATAALALLAAGLVVVGVRQRRKAVALAALPAWLGCALDTWPTTAPVAVVATPTVARGGNAESYPARLGGPVPVGAELTLTGSRGGWVRFALDGGEHAWLPRDALLPAGRD